ncbi:MAG: hypothetical protein RIQ53_2103 [Pseudomonadota bacterium]|jgi:phospholipase/carboxylesterase
MTTPSPTRLPATLEWLPADGQPPALLLVLLHGWGASAQDMAPLARTLHQQFPRAVIVAPDGFEPLDGAGTTPLAGRQWFSLTGEAGGRLSDDERPARVDAMLPRLADWLRAAQAAWGIEPQATALFGFSQGAIVSLELVQRHDGLCGRVLAFSGRYARLPEATLQHTTLHFFHGADDPVIPADHARAAMERLQQLQGDATIDIASGVGHAMPPALVQCALQRLTSHIPRRTWLAAMGAAGGEGAESAESAESAAGEDGPAAPPTPSTPSH